MIKKNTRLIAMITAITSITSITPAMAAVRLEAKDGKITTASAFKEGKYIYEGYKDDDENGVYFNDGSQDLILENISEFLEKEKDGKQSVWVKDDDDNEYKVNLEDGSLDDTIERDDIEDNLKTKLKTFLKKTKRYGEDTEITQFERIENSMFGEDTAWYSYTASGNEKYYDSVIDKENSRPEDNIPIKTQISITIKAFYSDVTIAGVTFSPDWGFGLSSTLADSLALSIKDTAFKGYKVISVDAAPIDSTTGSVKVVLGSGEKMTSLPDGFLKFGGNAPTWEMDVDIQDMDFGMGNKPQQPPMGINDEDLEDSIQDENSNSDDLEKNENENASEQIKDDSTLESENLSEQVKDNNILENEDELGNESESADREESENIEKNDSNDIEDIVLEDIDKNEKIEVFEEYINEPVQAKEARSPEEDETLSYFGYVSEDGNYIDCSKTANIKIYNGEKVVTIKEFNSSKTVNGKTVTVGMPKLVTTIGQDAGSIYSLIKVDVKGYQKLNGPEINEDAVTELFFIQKVSKVKGDEEKGAILPRKVSSYQLNNDATWTGGDNWSYLAAYYEFMSPPGTKKEIKIVEGDIIIAQSSMEKGQPVVKAAMLKLGGNKRITPVSRDENNNEYVDKSKKEIQLPLVYEDTANTEKINSDESWTMDHKGNVWSIYDGKISFSNSAAEFSEYYSCHKSINNIDAYDSDNFIAWSDEEDIYVTLRESEERPEKDVIKTGWITDEDGNTRVYDLTGKMVTGWYLQGSGWYFMNNEGIMQTGWVKDNDKWYYLAQSGMMKTGWLKDSNDKWYYLYADGSMAVNTIVDGYAVGSDGEWIK